MADEIRSCNVRGSNLSDDLLKKLKVSVIFKRVLQHTEMYP